MDLHLLLAHNIYRLRSIRPLNDVQLGLDLGTMLLRSCIVAVSDSSRILARYKEDKLVNDETI
jgi:hypothetical protein